MTEPDHGRSDRDVRTRVERQARRQQRARRESRQGLWFGLGMFGMVGWAVAVPTLIGVAIGLWLDQVMPQRFSWALALLLAGVALGAVNAWYWVERERRGD